MAIVSTVTLNQFINDFKEVRPNNFSYDGLSLLYDYLWELSDDIGENIVFDIIAICCDFSEYTLENWYTDYIDNGSNDYMAMLNAAKENRDNSIIAHNSDYTVLIIDNNA